MKTIYLILFRHGTEWDGQTILTTENKALFDLVKQRPYEETKLEDMPEELRKEVVYYYSEEELLSFTDVNPTDLNLTTSELLWGLSKSSSEYTNIPVIIGGYAEFTPPV